MTVMKNLTLKIMKAMEVMKLQLCHRCGHDHILTYVLMCTPAGNVSFLLSDPWPTGDRCGDYHIGAYVVITTLMLK